MLGLVFHIGEERYVLDVRKVLAVLRPPERVRRLPKVPDYVVGLMEHHGEPVPVIDLCRMILDRPSRRRLSTRLMIVDYPVDEDRRQPLALLAEQVTDTLRVEAEDFVPVGLEIKQAPYLGGVAKEREDLVQVVAVERLLPPQVAMVLFGSESEPAERPGEGRSGRAGA